MAVARKPPSPIYHADFPDTAEQALARLAECTRLEDREPPQRDLDDSVVSQAWIAWYDEIHRVRDALSTAVTGLIDHADYEAAHYRQWGDVVTVQSMARVAWAPVARRILRDMATARTMRVAADD